MHLAQFVHEKMLSTMFISSPILEGVVYKVMFPWMSLKLNDFKLHQITLYRIWGPSFFPLSSHRNPIFGFVSSLFRFFVLSRMLSQNQLSQSLGTRCYCKATSTGSACSCCRSCYAPRRRGWWRWRRWRRARGWRRRPSRETNPLNRVVNKKMEMHLEKVLFGWFCLIFEWNMF